MKRTFVATIFGFAACLGCFAQGNFTFNNSSSSLVWKEAAVPDILVKAGPDLYVAVMWSADTNAIPTTYLSGAATPTNAFFGIAAGVFSDPNFHLALDTSASNPPIVTTCGGPAPFQGLYPGGIRYIFGTSPDQTIQLYVIGWERSAGIDPVAASNVGSQFGFSSTLIYTLGSQGSPGGSLGNAGISAFGVTGLPVATPEPSTFALASLGAAALLISRRRTKQ